MSEELLDFKLGCTLGCGAFGKVRKAIHIPTGRKVAIKFLMKKKIRTDQDRRRVRRETQILKKIQHPNLIKLLQVAETDQTYHLVTQLVEGEELFQKINRLGKLDEQSSAHYFLQLLDAIRYLQKLGICHRDIKPENIIVRGNALKLIDFGLSSFFREGQLLKTSCGSPCYAAPQMMSEKSYDPRKTEVWALGITMYAMLTGRLPFEHDSTSKLYKIMAVGQYDEVQGISSSLKSLLKAMIEPNPQLRIDVEDICTHIWVRSFNYDFQKASKMTWSRQTLSKLQKTFKKTSQNLQKSIINDFGRQRINYFLVLQCRDGEVANDGPIHLSLVYFSLQAASKETSKKFPDAQWTSPYTASTKNQEIQIKKLHNSNIYTLCFRTKQ